MMGSEVLMEIIDDMKDLESNKVRQERGDKPNELRSSKKKKPKNDDGFAMLIQMGSSEKMDDKDEEMIKKILGE